MLEYLSKTIRAVTPKLSDDYSKSVRKSIDIMNAEYASDISLDTLSERVYLSKFHLCRIFKAETGVTPREYLTRLRIGKAKELLQITDLSQDEICEKTGICNSSYLSKHFLVSEGLTPGEYRKKWRS